MTNITIKIDGATAHKLGQQGALTTGMVGATVAFEFSPGWEGLIKTAVFRGGGVTRDLVGIGDTVPIPPEVLQAEGYLAVGVEGYDAEHTLVIPTTWENAAAYIHAGANASGDPAADPTLPIWAQLQAMIGDLSALDTNTKNNLVAAINELAAKSGGTVDDADIAELVEQYLADNPITAADVGAIPAPPTAEVGQTILVKAVNEKKEPVEWECVDVAGGGGDKWELIADTTLSEDAKSFSFACPDNTKKIRFVVDALAATENTTYTNFGVTMPLDGNQDYTAYVGIYSTPAIPRTVDTRLMVDFEVSQIDQDVLVSARSIVCEQKRTQTVGNHVWISPKSVYVSNPVLPMFAEISTSTYGTYAAGTRFRIWRGTA